MEQLSATFYAMTMRLFDMLGQGEQSARGKVILVTSARGGEGKTYIARIIARYMAELSDEEVLLVDGNIVSGALHREFKLDNQSGFADCLASGEFEGAAIHKTPVANLQVMTVGKTAKPALLYKSQSVQAFCHHFSQRFPLIVIDGGSLGSCGSLPHQSDGVILVVDASKTRREVIQGVMDQANVDQSKYIGAVLNKREQFIPPALYRYF